MPQGKPPLKHLSERILPYKGAPDPQVILPPKPGEDAGAVRLEGETILIVHPDPITGAEKRLGTLAVNVAANDIAATGARPRWFTLTLILPPDRGIGDAERIMKEAHQELLKLNASLLGGHTEWSDAVTRPVVVATAIGTAVGNRVVKTGGARPGDVLIISKPPGLEAAAIAAEDLGEQLRMRGVGEEVLREAGRLWESISVVPEALYLAESRLATAMHDPTEGGLVAAAFELSLASGWMVELWVSEVPRLPVVEEVLGAIGVDALRSLSSGSLLAAVPAGRVEEALRGLRSLGLESPGVVGRVLDAGGPGLRLLDSRGGRLLGVVGELPPDDFLSKLPGLGGG